MGSRPGRTTMPMPGAAPPPTRSSGSISFGSSGPTPNGVNAGVEAKIAQLRALLARPDISPDDRAAFEAALAQLQGTP
jgi:hypothetical protein